MIIDQLKSLGMGDTIVIAQVSIEDIPFLVQQFFLDTQNSLKKHGLDKKETNLKEIERATKEEVVRQIADSKIVKHLVFSQIDYKDKDKSEEAFQRELEERQVEKAKKHRFKMDYLLLLKNLRAELARIALRNKQDELDVRKILEPLTKLRIEEDDK